MLVMVRWVVLLAPIGVFALLLPLAARGGAGIAGAVGFYVVVYSIASVVVILLLYPAVAIAGGLPMRRFARAVAAGPADRILVEVLDRVVAGAGRGSGRDELELPDEVTGFVLPLAVSTFHVAAPLSWTVGAVFIGRFYGIPLHAGALATVAFASIFLAFVAPGIPRGAFLMLTPLFLAVGLPAEGIGILIAVDAIPDLFATVLNATGKSQLRWSK